MVVATSIGLVVLFILMGLVWLTLGPIINAIYPPTIATDSFHQGFGGKNLAIYIAVLGVFYVFSILLASFVSGFILRRLGKTSETYAWQGFVSGLIIGLPGPIYGALAFSDRPLVSLIGACIPALPSGVSALVGYYVASRKYKK